MTALHSLAWVTTTCQHCSGPFTAAADRVLSGGAKYCGDACRTAARRERVAARNGPCPACAGPRHNTFASYGLSLCEPCQTIAWRSCWRKRPHDTDPGPQLGEDGRALTAYHCELCDRWHVTSIARNAEMPAEYVAQRMIVAAYLRARGFDILAARAANAAKVPQPRADTAEPGECAGD